MCLEIILHLLSNLFPIQIVVNNRHVKLNHFDLSSYFTFRKNNNCILGDNQ